jgi:3-oxoadipate enol-lactonase
VAGTLERWFTPSFHTTGAAQLELVREMILGTGVEGYIGCAEAIRDMDMCGNLARISAPTLVLVGEGDPACTVEAAEILHSGIAKSELVIIPQAAHLPNIEQRERFNDLVVGFLDRQ